MLPNTNGTIFCDVFFSHRAVFPSHNKKNSAGKHKTSLGSTTTTYLTFIKCSRPLHKLVEAGARTQTDDDRQNSIITDKHIFLRFI